MLVHVARVPPIHGLDSGWWAYVRGAQRVLRAGALCAAINAVNLALIDAGVPMKDFVVGCTAGHLESAALVGESAGSEGI